jgi:hypothetical protein
MARNVLSLLVALTMIFCALSASNAAAAPAGAQAPPQQVQGQPVQPQQAQSSQALVGTWSTTVNWRLPSGLMITTTFMTNGRIQSTIQNHRGMSFTLAGTYEFNPAQGMLSYKWQDFAPKQTCIDGACTPAQPPVQMGVTITSNIKFLNSTEFVATSNDSSTIYVRTNAVGTPTP